MAVFGKRLSEYVSFSKWFVLLIAVAGIARLAMSLGGAEEATVRWASMTAVMWIGVIYFAVRTHTSGFGSYRHLLGVLALPNFTAQGIASAAIAVAIFTGADNIFSVPEFSFGGDGRTWAHLGSHLVIGTTLGTLVFWLGGCLVMFGSKKLAAGNTPTRAAARD